MSTEVAEELVVLLDADHRPVGTMRKAEVHGPDTPLHLAFSVYVFCSLVTASSICGLPWSCQDNPATA